MERKLSSRLAAKKFFKEYQLVASEVGNIVDFLKDTSCMGREKRLEMAACQAFRKYFSDDKEFNEFLSEMAEPTLTLMGHAEWRRDVLTDLGLRVSKADLTASLKELKGNERD